MIMPVRPTFLILLVKVVLLIDLLTSCDSFISRSSMLSRGPIWSLFVSEQVSL